MTKNFDLFFEESLIKVIGKGDKERFVPIGRIGQETRSTSIGYFAKASWCCQDV